MAWKIEALCSVPDVIIVMLSRASEELPALGENSVPISHASGYFDRTRA